ncbi:MAG: hypothetical protein H6600_00495 [Flavobacteriales bacterium]|nr:hypothetical protein [Flavobacteriales bacterium]
MKNALTCIILLTTISHLAQGSIFSGSDQFTLGTVTFCHRDWMGSENEMERLKQSVFELEGRLSKLKQDTTLNDTVSYVLIYSTEHVERHDPSNSVTHQFCIDTSGSGLRANITQKDLTKADFGMRKYYSYQNTYLIFQDHHMYVGNSTIFTTIKHYYVRADLYFHP